MIFARKLLHLPGSIGAAAGRSLPVIRALARWYERRPFLTLWGVLATGMVVMLVLFGRDAGLTLRQHVVLATVTVALAWLCTWIVFLDDADSHDLSD
ncbi:MAG: hypothetical protein HY332_13690 [Chloroflexi bacterium]|nr:hypothetical protein [Chloroflexota bacterium]